MAFEFVEHTGDAAVRMTSPDAAGLVRDAARALLSLYVADAADAVTELPIERELELVADDPEQLIVDLLGELIWLFDCKAFLCREIDVSLVSFSEPSRLQARLRGEAFDAAHHEALTEVKAATYHGLKIESTPQGLEATVVFDL
jgi:SHS2 domain-containing protein